MTTKKIFFYPNKVLSMETIIRIITDMVEVPMLYAIKDNKKLGSRKRRYVMARQLICYFARKYTTLSLGAIAAEINRDHATVCTSCKTVENDFNIDLEYREIFNKIDIKLLGVINSHKKYKVCCICGNPDIHIQAWVKLSDNTYVGPVDPEDKTAWCNNCATTTVYIDFDKFHKLQNVSENAATTNKLETVSNQV